MFAKKALSGLILTGSLWQFSSWAICHHVCILIIWPIFVYWKLPPPSSSAPAVSSYKQPCSDYFSPLRLWAEQNSMLSPTNFHPVLSVIAHLGQGLFAWPPLGLPWPSPQSRMSSIASWVFLFLMIIIQPILTRSFPRNFVKRTKGTKWEIKMTKIISWNKVYTVQTYTYFQTKTVVWCGSGTAFCQNTPLSAAKGIWHRSFSQTSLCVLDFTPLGSYSPLIKHTAWGCLPTLGVLHLSQAVISQCSDLQYRHFTDHSYSFSFLRLYKGLHKSLQISTLIAFVSTRLLSATQLDLCFTQG